MNRLATLLATCAASVLAACGTTPTTITEGATTARPPEPVAATPTNGAIFQTQTHRPLFEDRRARQVGDLITLVINEKTQAGKQASSSGNKSGSVNTQVGGLLGLPASTLNRLSVSGSSDIEYEDGARQNSSNSFTGTVTVTVTEVLPNGNLRVAGEKQIALDKGIEYVRVSGIVQPDTIQAGNRVSSAQVADARIEYRTSSRIDSAEVMGWLTRFFLSMAPL